MHQSVPRANPDDYVGSVSSLTDNYPGPHHWPNRGEPSSPGGHWHWPSSTMPRRFKGENWLEPYTDPRACPPSRKGFSPNSCWVFTRLQMVDPLGNIFLVL